MFKRNGDNLEVEVPLTIPEALAGRRHRGADAQRLQAPARPAGTKHGTVQRLRGEGPARLGGKGNGDIHYRFVLDVPSSLSPEQSEAVDRLSKVMNGNPRERTVRRRPAGEARVMASAPAARTTTRVEVSSDRGVFMISVAAELAEMHPQTLRMYEARGLIEPKRSPKGTRLYSQKDVDRLRRIQEMTAELGMNLAGVERVFELEQQLDSMSRKVAALQKRADELSAEVERLEALRRELRAEIVPYVRGGELVRHADLRGLDFGVRAGRERLTARRPGQHAPSRSTIHRVGVCNDLVRAGWRAATYGRSDNQGVDDFMGISSRGVTRVAGPRPRRRGGGVRAVRRRALGIARARGELRRPLHLAGLGSANGKLSLSFPLKADLGGLDPIRHRGL